MMSRDRLERHLIFLGLDRREAQLANYVYGDELAGVKSGIKGLHRGGQV